MPPKNTSAAVPAQAIQPEELAEPRRWPKRQAGFGASFYDLRARMGRDPMTPEQMAWRHARLRLRFAEISRLRIHRIAKGLPLDERAFALAMASCLEPNDAVRWIGKNSPSLSRRTAQAIVAEVEACGRIFKAQRLGDLLALTMGERENLVIKTFRPAGMSPADFRRYTAQRKKGTDNLRAEGKRRSKGVVPRKQGDSAAAEAEKCGVSRRTIFNRRKQAKEAEAGLHSKFAIGSIPEDIPELRVQRGSRTPPPWMLRALDKPRWMVPAEYHPETARIGLLVAAQAAEVRAVAIGRAA